MLPKYQQSEVRTEHSKNSIDHDSKMVSNSFQGDKTQIIKPPRIMFDVNKTSKHKSISQSKSNDSILRSLKDLKRCLRK